MASYSKVELVSELAKKSGVSKPKIKKILDEIAEIAYREIPVQGFSFPGLCKFDTIHKAKRRVRNPMTGAILEVGEHDIVRVRPLKKAREVVPAPPRPIPVAQEILDKEAALAETTATVVKSAEATAEKAPVASAPKPFIPASSAPKPFTPPVAKAEESAPAPEQAPAITNPEAEPVAPAVEPVAETLSAEAAVVAEEVPEIVADQFEEPAIAPEAATIEEAPVAEQPAEPAQEAQENDAPIDLPEGVKLVSFRCKNPNCMQEIEATDDMAGQYADCPTCGEPVQIPYFSEPGTLHGPVESSITEGAETSIGRTIRIDLSDDDLM